MVEDGEVALPAAPAVLGLPGCLVKEYTACCDIHL
jgi:hypothetical protein